MKNTIISICLIISGVLTVNVCNAQSVTIGDKTYETITSAIHAAGWGDVIEISGKHTENITVYKEITLKGTDPEKDIIQAGEQPWTDGAGRVLFIKTAVTIENLGIHNGSAGQNIGGGIFINRWVKGTTHLKNLIIKNNESDKSAGGIGIQGADVVIENCRITENKTSGFGGGINVLAKKPSDGKVVIKNTVIDNNEAQRNGGGLYTTGQFGKETLVSIDIENSVIAFNRTNENGGGAFIKGAPYQGAGQGYGKDNSNNVAVSMKHVTVAYNDSKQKQGEGINFYGQPQFEISNSIVSLNGDRKGTNTDMNFGGSHTTNVSGNVFGSIYFGNAVMNRTNNMLRKFQEIKLSEEFNDKKGSVPVLMIGKGSVAIDKGEQKYAAKTDIVGKERNEGNAPDAGAIEFR